MLEHGGRLRSAAAEYGIPLESWLDLSTGINPCGWSVPQVPAQEWLRLPEEDDGLELAAAAYYGSACLLPVNGSQAAIQTLPKLRDSSVVGVLSPSFNEHRYAWETKGHQIKPLRSCEIEQAIEHLDVLVLCNPNNPDGVLFSPEQLMRWHRMLACKGGWLVVDEAFIDPMPARSLIATEMPQGLIVLRSLGKFFGLAGARVGFVFAGNELLKSLQISLGPWSVSGPSRWVAKMALADSSWQANTRMRLNTEAHRLHQLLVRAGLNPRGQSLLFRYVECDNHRQVAERLASQGVLVRRFAQSGALRFGLPGNETDWQRLEQALIPTPGERESSVQVSKKFTLLKS